MTTKEPYRFIFRVYDTYDPADANLKLHVTSDLSTTQAFDMRGFAGGCIYNPTGSGVSQFDVYTALTADGVFLPYRNDDGQITITVAEGNAQELPPAMYGCFFVKLKANAAGDIGIGLKG